MSGDYLQTNQNKIQDFPKKIKLHVRKQLFTYWIAEEY